MSGEFSDLFDGSDRTQHAAGLFDLGFRDLTENGGEQPGDRIGRYCLLSMLGEGGFGVVWRAEQTEPIRRELALKLIKRGMDSREIIARFGAESRALALMEHPNIAAVLDAGNTPDGRPYFAMELVRGEPLTDYCDSRSLTVRERLELFIPVCQAVQHAHQKAILHRDLKPSNILVAVVDGKSVPKVIDFGIAKALGTPEDGSLLRTRVGAVIGTPQYMSPEQAGSMADVDTRSDIYSLGVILHELLTGGTPFARSGVDETSQEETLRRIRMEEPLKPSSRFHSSTAEARHAAVFRGVDPTKLRRTLRGDLDWIVLNSLEKDRRRRYETANALAADLTRYLNEEPVSAAAPTWHYQFSKFALRNRVGLATAGIVFAALVTGALVSLWQAREARKSSAEARANYEEARFAVEQYLSRVTENPRLKEENFETLRRDLLETAMPFYEKMASRANNDPSLESDRAWAMGRLARVYYELDDSSRSEKMFREAIAIHERFAARFPEDRKHLEALTLTYHNLTLVLSSQGRHQEGAPLQQRAVEVSRKLVARFPDEPELRFGLMTTLITQALQMNGQNRKTEAERSLDEAFHLGTRLVEEVPSAVDYRIQLASCLCSIAGLHHDAGRFQESEQCFQEAIRLQENLDSEFSNIQIIARTLANTYHNYGHLLTQQGRGKEAVPVLLRGVGIHRRLLGNFPDHAVVRAELAGILSVLGNTLIILDRDSEALPLINESLDLLRKLGEEKPEDPQIWYVEGVALERLALLERHAKQWKIAADHFQEAADCQRQALRFAPGTSSYQMALQSHLSNLASLEIEAGNGKAAADALISISEGRYTEPDGPVNIAVLLAKAVALIQADPSLSSAEKIATSERCAAIAVESLKSACQLGYSGLESAKKDQRFSPFFHYEPFLAMAEPPPDPVDRSPAGFTFFYPHDDPGKRVWTRADAIWKEVMPSGKENLYQIKGRLRVAGISGTELFRPDQTSFRLFIPDRGTGDPLVLKFRIGTADWQQLGAMDEVR